MDICTLLSNRLTRKEEGSSARYIFDNLSRLVTDTLSITNGASVTYTFLAAIHYDNVETGKIKTLKGTIDAWIRGKPGDICDLHHATGR
jgi:hypothetical protein